MTRNTAQLIEDGVEARLKDIFSAGGISFGRMSLELLYYIPRSFRDAYVECFHQALGSDDSGTGARGRAAAEAGAVGRARGKARGSAKRTWRGEFIVQDERALRLKEKADKRLRALAREMVTELEEIRLGRRGKDEVVDTGKGGLKKVRITAQAVRAARRRCPLDQMFMDVEWRFCPYCGTNLED